MEKTTTQTLQTQRTIAYSPSEIYAAFSKPDHLAKWWGPKDFTNTFEIFEFKVGGNWEFVMHSPDGKNYFNKNTFKELIINKKIVIQHIVEPLFTLTVSLSSTEQGTLVRWIQTFDDPKVADAVRHICEPSNEQTSTVLNMFCKIRVRHKEI